MHGRNASVEKEMKNKKPFSEMIDIATCVENLLSHGLEGAQCEYNINNETMRQIKLIMRYLRMMPMKYQIWNISA